jgi:hypothetical protein
MRWYGELSSGGTGFAIDSGLSHPGISQVIIIHHIAGCTVCKHKLSKQQPGLAVRSADLQPSLTADFPCTLSQQLTHVSNRLIIMMVVITMVLPRSTVIISNRSI